jgi:hypothetical protein
MTRPNYKKKKEVDKYKQRGIEKNHDLSGTKDDWLGRNASASEIL